MPSFRQIVDRVPMLMIQQIGCCEDVHYQYTWHTLLNCLHDIWDLQLNDCYSVSGIVIFKLIVMTDSWGISCEIVLRWMSLDLTDDMSTLVQVMVCCHQPTSHYLSQCWPGSVLPYGVTRPQWVKPNMPPENFYGSSEALYDIKIRNKPLNSTP